MRMDQVAVYVAAIRGHAEPVTLPRVSGKGLAYPTLAKQRGLGQEIKPEPSWPYGDDTDGESLQGSIFEVCSEVVTGHKSQGGTSISGALQTA